MMKREDCFKVLARHVTDDQVVVATYSSAVEWNDLGPRVLNYFSMGAMGLASSHALGLALANPNRRIIVLDGDGSLLMNLGSLVTIAAVAPANLVEVVLENGLWELPGAVPLPGAGRASLAGFARAAGWKNIVEVDTVDDFRGALQRALREPGPWFLSARVAPGSGQGLPPLKLVDMTRKLRASLSR